MRDRGDHDFDSRTRYRSQPAERYGVPGGFWVEVPLNGFLVSRFRTVVLIRGALGNPGALSSSYTRITCGSCSSSSCWRLNHNTTNGVGIFTTSVMISQAPRQFIFRFFKAHLVIEIRSHDRRMHVLKGERISSASFESRVKGSSSPGSWISQPSDWKRFYFNHLRQEFSPPKLCGLTCFRPLKQPGARMRKCQRQLSIA